MGPGYTTIIAPLAGDTALALKDYLRTSANPGPPAAPGQGLRCREDFPFDGIPTLHFCSLLVLDADPEAGIPAELVLEATFDGDRDAFLDDLLASAPLGMQRAFAHCRGYPLAGAPPVGESLSPAQREAFHAYLSSHDVGASAFFSGSFGRTVAQIRDEHRLRTALREDLARQRLGPKPMPPTNAALQGSLQERVAADPTLDFARTPAPEPWPIRWREGLASVTGWALLAALAGVGALVLAAAGLGPWRLWHGAARVLEVAHAASAAVIAGGWPGVGGLMAAWPVLSGFLALLLARIALRAWELHVETGSADPHRQSSLSAALAQGLSFVRLALSALLVQYLLVLLAVTLLPGLEAEAPAARNEIAAVRGALGLAGQPGVRTTLLGLAAVLLLLALLAWTAGSLALAGERDPARFALARRLAAEHVAMLKIAGLVAAAVLVLRPFAPALEPVLRELALLPRLLALAMACAAAGLAVAFVAEVVLLALIRSHEIHDCFAYHSADELMRVPLANDAARAREERATNITQNHLASLTYVKPGAFRLLLLRATLWFIGLLARYWFNQGSLGGISTILSARWVVIDGGRRLIFLDNYGGGWESYLNEFIDMGAVKGLNAIWCNTFIKWRPPGAADGARRIAFPATSFSTARGAQSEGPFKRYVRASQLETLAWYGAYHTLSIRGINTSSGIRRQLFQPLESHEVDALVSDL
ncbi:MAG: hypothetical protein NW223_15780 [Hyphomicrobiaceae bacterium]|nr:hypothetical protein [Hyphomicrobiaceae bacterium]